MFKVTRRGFMVGCSAAIASMTGGLSFTAFGSQNDEPNQSILIVVFLRGGCDGLNVVLPIAGPDRGYYLERRPNIGVPTSGEGAALPLTDLFGLHPAAAPLLELYQQKKLAIVHAAGLTSDTRSHFDAMQYMELGTPDSKSMTSGWLTRHLQSATNLPPEITLPALSAGATLPTSLSGSFEAAAMSTPNDFSFNGNWKYGGAQRHAMRQMYNGGSWLHEAGLQTLNAVDVIEWGKPGNYTPENGAIYPQNSFGNNLKTVAQLIKMQLGLRVATVDLGGWDTHEYQGDNAGGYFAGQLGGLAQGLHAFYTDMSDSGGTDYTKRVTIAVMSEFGRSFAQNGSRGTDHGHGNIMFVLGGEVNGGKVYGKWPGLAMEQLYDRRDLQITTDYRQVLSEILIRRMGNPNLGAIFPKYGGYQPLNIVQGADLTPIYTPIVAPGEPSPLPDVGGTDGDNSTPVPPGADEDSITPVPPGAPDVPDAAQQIYMPAVMR
jgi:uncharacterized protein (DUF1501 family)